MKWPVTALVAVLLALTATSCDSDQVGIPDPTEDDRAELESMALAYPGGYCVLAWEKDGEYDVTCYPMAVSAPYSERAYYAPAGCLCPPMMHRPPEYKAPKVKLDKPKPPANKPPAPAKPPAQQKAPAPKSGR